MNVDDDSANGVGSLDESGDDSSISDNEHHPPAKRKRLLTVSCEKCKERKVRCDRNRPACGWCTKNAAQCVYLPRKKPGLRAGYGRELEARLDNLHKILEQQQSQISQLINAQVASTNAGPSPQDITSLRCSPLVQTPHVPRPETALFLQRSASVVSSQNTFRDRFGSNVTDNRPILSPSRNSFDDVQSRHPHLPRNGYNLMNDEQFRAASSRSGSAADADFPPYDLLYALVELFFKHIYPWCPILHRQSTLNSLFGENSSLDDADLILLHAIVATTIRFSTDPRLTIDSTQRYHKNSKEKVLLYGIQNSSVKSLQALVILALDVVGCSNGPPGWNLLALITRSVVQLGLATETYSPAVAPQCASIYTLRAIVLPESKDWIEEETRRRLFWQIYVLDRYATIATAFAFALDESEIDRRLPARDDMFVHNMHVETKWFRTTNRTEYTLKGPGNMGSFSYFIEVLGILTRIHNFLKQPVDITALEDVELWQSQYKELDHALEQWKYDLPEEFSNSARSFAKSTLGPPVNVGLVMLHAAFYTSTIRLHSSAAYPTHRSPIFSSSYSASQRCLNAVENITALCAYVRENNVLSKLGPPFAFSLWVAARVLLVHGSTIDHQVDSSINLLVSTLEDMGQYWEMGSRYGNLLARVLSEYQESRQVPMGMNGERETPSTVKILADMRRCAFDLDFLISRQPKASTNPKPTAVIARTPMPNEFEYLDVFDFFNMPRLPVSLDGMISYPAMDDKTLQDDRSLNEPNITNFMVDASADWFIPQTT